MNMREYQIAAIDTAVDTHYERDRQFDHRLAGVLAEAGEVCGAEQKHLRGDYGFDEYQHRLRKELGRFLWYVAAYCDSEDMPFPPAEFNTADEPAISAVCLFTATTDFIRCIIDLDELMSVAARVTLLAATTLDEIALANIKQLSSRKERGVLKGDGDDR